MMSSDDFAQRRAIFDYMAALLVSIAKTAGQNYLNYDWLSARAIGQFKTK
uniref:Uncharacterized protein n=1 Tax=Anopheles atroparvus TaxID=41427 RepID=A0AAG5DPQ8_ANOAO